jgi:glucose-1-phosphate thymidylyltransferase
VEGFSIMTVKAILVAGGHGSRLAPFTNYLQKTLLPLYDRPVIDYALGTIRRAGITDITVVSNRFVDQIAHHVGQGLPGERIQYVVEETPLGVAHALSLAQPINENERVMVYFSDNITTVEFAEHVQAFAAAKTPPGCVLIAREEPRPEAFGVAVLSDRGKVIDVVEKPSQPPSNLAIGGIYLFDETFWQRLDVAAKEAGAAFSITDVTRTYVLDGQAKVVSVGAETWMDCGTPEALLQASLMAKDGKLNPNQER